MSILAADGSVREGLEVRKFALSALTARRGLDDQVLRFIMPEAVLFYTITSRCHRSEHSEDFIVPPFTHGWVPELDEDCIVLGSVLTHFSARSEATIRSTVTAEHDGLLGGVCFCFFRPRVANLGCLVEKVRLEVEGGPFSASRQPAFLQQDSHKML